VNLWDLSTRTERAGSPGVGPLARHFLALAPDGARLATAQKGSLWIWDLSAWQLHQPAGQPPAPIRALAYTPDGRTLLTLGTDRPARLRRPLPFGLPGGTDHAVAGAAANVLRLWDVASGRQAGALNSGYTVGLYCLALAPDGRTIAAGGEGGSVWLWDRLTGAARPPRFVSEPAREYLEWMEPHGLLRAVPRFPIFHEHVAALAFSPDGKVLATASEDNAGTPFSSERSDPDSEFWTVKLWDAARGEELRALPGKHRLVRCLSFAPDGRTVATNDGAEVRLWDVATGQLRQTRAGHGGPVRCLAFSPDGALLATGGDDWHVRLWDLRDGRQVPPLLGHTDVVASVAFAPDGRTLASGGHDGKVNLWNVAAAQPVAALEGHSGKIFCVGFSPDGRTLASGGDSAAGVGEVFLWRAGRPDP
jgi:WD40 repeat protein